MSQVGHLHIAR